MTPFDQAWSLLKSDVDIYREVSPDIFQDMSYMTEPLSDEELKVVTDFFGNIEDRAVRAKDSGQIYPQGNLPQYHPAIYGLMARQKIQDSFNEGFSRAEIERANLFSNMSADIPEGVYHNWPAGEPIEFWERDDFDDELQYADAFEEDLREQMTFDEMYGKLSRESTGY